MRVPNDYLLTNYGARRLMSANLVQSSRSTRDLLKYANRRVYIPVLVPVEGCHLHPSVSVHVEQVSVELVRIEITVVLVFPVCSTKNNSVNTNLINTASDEQHQRWYQQREPPQQQQRRKHQ